MADYLPTSAPTWRSLRELSLVKMSFSEFPEGLAGALVSLTFLNLAQNGFARLPSFSPCPSVTSKRMT